jgi:probable HAF family extracellular repeat protein
LGQVTGDFLTGDFIDDGFGNLSPVYHAFVWTEGTLQDLGTLGGWGSLGLWINDQGVVVGASSSDNTDGLPSITRDGQMRSLPSLISNPAGWKLALETHYVAADGRIWGLGTSVGKNHIYEMTPETNGMYRIRSRGVIEAIDVQVFAFNEYGQAVGRVWISSDRGGGAFLWDDHGLSLLDAPGKPASYAYSVNTLGQVVGMTTFVSPSYNAFLWENGTMFNLNDLIPSDSAVVLTKAGASAINDAGQIVCTYRNVASGLYGVCLLVPVTPVPLEITQYELKPAGLSLEVQGGAGQPLAVEYTSDWTEWKTLATSTNLFGKRMFIDPDASGHAFRAYRARLLAP